MMVRSLCCLVLLALIWPGTVAAQQETQRERLTFLGTALEIEVLVDVPGSLRLIRGQAGEIAVTASAATGLAGFGLAGANHDRLQLTAVDAERVNYLVVVPEGVQVRVRLPDRHVTETPSTMQRSVEYSWEKAL